MMPYSEKQRKVLQAIKHGWRPTGSFKNVSAGKAAKMLSHGTKKKTGAHTLARG
jgi:hypothetical protein